MTPGALLSALRAKGYSVTVAADGTVRADGPTPKDPARAAAMLREHQDGLLALLRAETEPRVADAVEVLGAKLVRVDSK